MSDEPLGELDARIHLAGAPNRDCFICGKVVVPNTELNDPHRVSSPRAGNIELTAHGFCLRSTPDWEVASRYQLALWAALTGKNERTQDAPRLLRHRGL